MKNSTATEHAQESTAASLGATNIEMRSIDLLKPHPLHGKIYRNDDIKDLLASIEDAGILTPLRIAPDGMIISGHRRLAAAKQLGWSEVPVVVRTSTGKTEEIVQELFESNVQRVKTNEELMREYAQHLEVEKKLAKTRQGRRTDLTAGDSIRANSPTSQENGRARDIAADKIGVSSRTAVDGLAVIHAVDAHAVTNQDKAKELLRVLNEQSINAAYELAVEWKWIANKSSVKNAAHSEPESPAEVGQNGAPDLVASQQSVSTTENSRLEVEDETHSSGASSARADDRNELRNGSTIKSHARIPAVRKRTPASTVKVEPLDAKGRNLLTSDAVLKAVCSNSRSEEDCCMGELKPVVDKFVDFVTSHLGPQLSSSSVHQTVEVLRSISDLLLESYPDESGCYMKASGAK